MKTLTEKELNLATGGYSDNANENLREIIRQIESRRIYPLPVYWTSNGSFRVAD